MKQFTCEVSSKNGKQTFICKNAVSSPNQEVSAMVISRNQSRKSASVSSSTSRSSPSYSSCSSETPCPGRTCEADCPNVNTEECFDLTYNEIKDDFFDEMSQAIYHQYLWQEDLQIPTKILRHQTEHAIDIKKVENLAKADKRSSIIRDPYNKNFTKFNWRFNAPDQQELDVFDDVMMQNVMNHVISYYTNRGFALPDGDKFNKFKDQYIWNASNGQIQTFTGLGFISMRLIYADSKCADPSFIDLIATASDTTDSNNISSNAQAFIIDTYEPNPLARQNGHGYPVRIPITRDFCKFQSMKDAGSVAYLDTSCYVLTIYFADEAGHLLFDLQANTGNPDLDIDLQDYMNYFFGSFKMLKRDNNKESFDNESTLLTVSRPRETQYFAQVSDGVFTSSTQVSHGVPTVFNNPMPLVYNILGDGNRYTGVVMALTGGITASFDVHAITGPINAYVISEDPFDVPEDDENLPGDAPGTGIVEKYSIPSNTTFYDTSDILIDSQELDEDVLRGKYLPEELAITPIPTPTSIEKAFSNTALHEFVHVSHLTSGIIEIIPTEAMAVGIESDPIGNRNVFFGFRGRAFVQRLTRHTRANFSAARPDSGSLRTYGMGLFWKFIADHVDPNYQVTRRISEILSSETAGPLFRDNNYPFVAPNLNINTTGVAAAIDQALHEVAKSSLEDMWFDFSVASVILRNNKAIPKNYRYLFPVWIWSQNYAGFSAIIDMYNVNGLPLSTANWWDYVENNLAIPADWNTPYTGDSPIAALPSNFSGSSGSYRTFSFNVPHNVNEITVNADGGKWKVIVVQFTSDGVDSSSSSSSSGSSSRSNYDGKWIQDGPHKLSEGGKKVFRIKSHKPRYSSDGNIRLVCVNVTPLSGNGTSLDDYFQPENDNGSISISVTY